MKGHPVVVGTSLYIYLLSFFLFNQTSPLFLSVDTAPPKHILNPEARLIDENLIPSAIVYYSGQSSLKSSVKMKLTDPRAANIEAMRIR